MPVDGWRWIFYSTAIVSDTQPVLSETVRSFPHEQSLLTRPRPQFSAFVQFIGFFLLRETYGPILLLREAHRLKRSMGLPADSDRVQTIHESKAGRKSVRQIVAHGMLRPFSLFISEQIIMLFAAYMSVIYG